jgi:hypothetical protein
MGVINFTLVVDPKINAVGEMDGSSVVCQSVALRIGSRRQSGIPNYRCLTPIPSLGFL